MVHKAFEAKIAARIAGTTKLFGAGVRRGSERYRASGHVDSAGTGEPCQYPAAVLRQLTTAGLFAALRTVALTLSVLFVVCAAAEARQSVNRFADLSTRIKSGDRVFVKDASGQETSGVFAKVSDTSLSILVNGNLREVPATEVREIARQGDSVRNGLLIGAAFGAGVAAIAVVGTSSECKEPRSPYSGCIPPAAGAVVAVAGGLVYGGIGALIDHFIKGRTVVFKAQRTAFRLSPGFSVGEREVRASIVLSTR